MDRKHHHKQIDAMFNGYCIFIQCVLDTLNPRLNSVSSFTFSFFSCFLLVHHEFTSNRVKNDSPRWWMFDVRTESASPYLSWRNLQQVQICRKKNHPRAIHTLFHNVSYTVSSSFILIHPHSSSIPRLNHFPSLLGAESDLPAETRDNRSA